MINWPAGRLPKVMKTPSFGPELRKLIRTRNEPGMGDKVIDLARRTAHDFFRLERPFYSALQSYLDLCATVNEISNDVMGVQRATGDNMRVSNTFMLQVGIYWMAMPSSRGYGNTDLDLCVTVANSLRNAGEYSWFFPKVNNIYTVLFNRNRTLEYVRSLAVNPELQGLYEALRQYVGREVPALVRETMEALHTHRKYGVKPAYWQDGMLHQPDQAWVIGDVDGFREIDDPFSLYGSMMAQIFLTTRRSIQSIDAPIRTDRGVNYSFHAQEIDFDPLLACFMSPQGEIELAPGGGLTLRSLFCGEGKEFEYELLRLAMAMRLYDLTVPLEIVGKHGALPLQSDTSGGLLGRLLNRDDEKSRTTRLRRLLDPTLILPRIKRLTEGDIAELVEAFEREREDDIERTKRRRHDVIGHARILREGHHASPAAIAMAAADKVRLEPNETYVRKHERNKEGEPASRPHRARPR